MPRSAESAQLGGMAMTQIAIDPRRFRVPVSGERRLLRLMHVTDSHVDLGPDPQSGSAKLCEYLHKRYARGTKALEQRGTATVATESFRAHVALAEERGAEVLAHTGDLLNFPSPRAARWAADVMCSGSCDVFFCCGNHDWQHYPTCLEGTPIGSDRLRAEWCTRALAPLFPYGRQPLHWVEDRGGLRFIAIDNSAGYILPAQLEFFRAQAASARSGGGSDADGGVDNTRASSLMIPTVLLVHIPLYSAALLAEGRADGHAMMTASNLLYGAADAPPDQLTTWEGHEAEEAVVQQQRRLETTTQFLACVAEEPSLIAVLSGHIHDHNCQPFGSHGAVQITTDSGAYNGCRLVDFIAAPSAEHSRL